MGTGVKRYQYRKFFDTRDYSGLDRDGGRRREEGQEATRPPLAELEAEAESQLVLLDLSVSVDVAVTHQGFPELVQVRSTDAGLWVGYRKVRGQRAVLCLVDQNVWCLND